jgi:hypothetical protein
MREIMGRQGRRVEVGIKIMLSKEESVIDIVVGEKIHQRKGKEKKMSIMIVKRGIRRRRIKRKSKKKEIKIKRKKIRIVKNIRKRKQKVWKR